MFSFLAFVVFVAVVLSAKHDPDPDRSIRFGKVGRIKRAKQPRRFNLPL